MTMEYVCKNKILEFVSSNCKSFQSIILKDLSISAVKVNKGTFSIYV